jgi:hypothetical protein
MDTFSYTNAVARKLQFIKNNFFKGFLGVPFGRAIRCNLFIFKEKIKRISTAIPNAVYGLQNIAFLFKAYPARFQKPCRYFKFPKLNFQKRTF